MLDSGAAADCISEALCKDLEVAVIQSSTGTYMAADGSSIQVSGHAWVSIKWKRPPFGPSARAKIKFSVIKDLQVDMLIGAKTIEHQNMRDCAMLAPILLTAQSKKARQRKGIHLNNRKLPESLKRLKKRLNAKQSVHASVTFRRDTALWSADPTPHVLERPRKVPPTERTPLVQLPNRAEEPRAAKLYPKLSRPACTYY